MTRTRRRRSAFSSARPLVAFLLIASFGILFVGCNPSEKAPATEEFTFTAEDVARFKELTQKAEEGLDAIEGEGGPQLYIEGQLPQVPVLDLSMVDTFNSIRSGPSAEGEDIFRVTNEFLNVREEPRITAGTVGRFDRGDVVKLIEFVDAAWARVVLPGGREGYIAQRYISKLTSEERLPAEKEKYKDVYFVDFGFLNVRSTPDTNSEKIGELPGQAFVKILSKDETWARIPFERKEGYVAVEYLSPFLPNFIVRQGKFTLPLVHYRLSNDDILRAVPAHLDKLKQGGLRLVTLKQFRDLLLEQEERDVRLEPNTVAIVFSEITPENVGELSDVLRASNVKATLFVETKSVGLNGITEKTILTLLANGHDIQSASHSGDDLRSLTNAQVELELKQSRKLLEEYTKRPVFAIAYPLGGVNSRVEQKAQESGYLLGIGTGQERTFSRDQLLRIPSFVISESASAEEVVGLVKGE